jgi:hypothetical protein
MFDKVKTFDILITMTTPIYNCYPFVSESDKFTLKSEIQKVEKLTETMA